MVNKSKVKVLFAEPQYSPSSARTIAAETGAKIYSLDPAVQEVTDGNAYNEYINVMETNLISLKEALG
jgi:zinc transport system substrate-binding protein